MSDGSRMPLLTVVPPPVSVHVSEGALSSIRCGERYVIIIELPRDPHQPRALRAVPGEMTGGGDLVGAGLLFPHTWHRQTGEILNTVPDSVRYKLCAWRAYHGAWRVLDPSLAGMLNAVDDIIDAEDQ